MKQRKLTASSESSKRPAAIAGGIAVVICAALVMAAGFGCSSGTGDVAAFTPLPYAKDSLAPYVSAQTLEVHHAKHFQSYVNNTNKLVSGTGFQSQSLEAIIGKTYGKKEDAPLFNNAAQAFNHAFYFNCMTPGGGGKPTGLIADKIGKSFGSYEKFAQAFVNAAVSQFGSGWIWLVEKENGLEIVNTQNADTPIAQGINPLLVIDVWEHAYYLDYQNRKGDYVQAFVEHLINWKFVEKNLKNLEKVQKPAIHDKPVSQVKSVNEVKPACVPTPACQGKPACVVTPTCQGKPTSQIK